MGNTLLLVMLLSAHNSIAGQNFKFIVCGGGGEFSLFIFPLTCSLTLLQISTLQILRTEEEEENPDISEDQIFQSRQALRHVCVALKKYFEAHLGMKADQIRRSHVRHERESPLPDSPIYKVCSMCIMCLSGLQLLN